MDTKTIRFDREVVAVHRVAPPPPPPPREAAPPPPPPDVVTPRLEAAMREVLRAVSALEEKIAGLESSLEREAVALSLAACERVLGEEVSDGRARVEALLKPAIQDLLRSRGAGRLVVRVHPEVLEAIGKRASDFVAELRALADVRSDPAIARDGAIVETAEGTVEVGVRAALNRLRDELLGSEA